jgi:hypothetical protein
VIAMMLSERKRLIRRAEKAALLGSIACLALAAGVHAGVVSARVVELLLVPSILVAFAVLGLALLLFSEYAQVLHGRPLHPSDEEGLSIIEMRQMVRWCPKPVKLALPLAAAILIFTFVTIGGVEWSSNEPFTEREAKGFPLFISVLMLLALPILSSAAKMPGSFFSHFSAEDSISIK